MKKLTTSGFAKIATVALLAAAALVPSANAQIALTAGSFTIKAEGYSADALVPGTNAPGGYVVPGSGGEIEDTWGILQITSILNGSTTVFTENGAQGEYWGFIYGSYDVAQTDLGDGDAKFKAQGLKIDIYAKSIVDTGDAQWQTTYLQGIGGRTAFNQYTNITNGTLVFSGSLIGQMTSFFVANTGGTSATGNLAATYNTLFTTPPNTGLADLSFTLGGLTSNAVAGWSDKFGGPIDGSVVPVPEPSTYGLIAAGALLGLVAFRRMKVRASAV